MVDVPCLDHLWDGQKDCTDVGQVSASIKKHQEKYFSGREIQMISMPRQRGVTEFDQKEPCLTPTLMDEGQARNPNTTYDGYKMEFWKFA